MTRKRKMFSLFLMLLAIALLLYGCADVASIEILNPNEHVYGFWGGTWHGMIMTPSFIGSLIWDDVAIYAVNNNGHWYNFGFIGGFFFITSVIKRIFYIFLYSIRNGK